MNYFDPKSAAERYAKGRPYYHPQVIGKIKARLKLIEPVERAMDIGCGTGLSTIALKEVARQIVGTDISSEMVALAPSDPKIIYSIAPAEELPVKDNAFDLMTLSSVFHWINRSRFFAEARRVLRPKGWMVIFDNSFYAHMVENNAFHIWFMATYLQKFPSPPRHRADLSVEETEKEGFALFKQEQYQNLVAFSLTKLTDYLVTQSNVIAAVEGGNQTIDDVCTWVTENIQPFFEERTEAAFGFGGPIWYLQKA
jgi:ubiquinone/menaquinone biosynthesis C-methylase UbiE